MTNEIHMTWIANSCLAKEDILGTLKVNHLITIKNLFSSGAFGRVYSGIIVTEHGTSTSEQKVYVKTVTGLCIFQPFR